MHQFLKDAMEWVLDKEEQSADTCHVPLKQIDKQIAAVQARKDKYQAECEDNLHEMEHILVRLHKMRDKNQDCAG